MSYREEDDDDTDETVSHGPVNPVSWSHQRTSSTAETGSSVAGLLGIPVAVSRHAGTPPLYLELVRPDVNGRVPYGIDSEQRYNIDSHEVAFYNRERAVMVPTTMSDQEGLADRIFATHAVPYGTARANLLRHLVSDLRAYTKTDPMYRFMEFLCGKHVSYGRSMHDARSAIYVTCQGFYWSVPTHTRPTIMAYTAMTECRGLLSDHAETATDMWNFCFTDDLYLSRLAACVQNTIMMTNNTSTATPRELKLIGINHEQRDHGIEYLKNAYKGRG